MPKLKTKRAAAKRFRRQEPVSLREIRLTRATFLLRRLQREREILEKQL